MIKALTNEQMRTADKYTIETLGVPSLELMERVGKAVAQEVLVQLENKPLSSVLVVCGGGNNGGDGFVVARLLQEQAVDVKVLTLAEDFSLDCIVKKLKYKGEILSEIPTEPYDVIVDCIFGTGLSRKIEGKEKELVEFINQSEAYVLSVDIPSGLNGNNGQVLGVCVRADKTVTVQAIKLGLLLNDGKDQSGEIKVADVGIDTSAADRDCVKIAQKQNIAQFFKKRKSNSHKGSYGKATIVAGSAEYSGAPLLSTASALRGGAGFTQLCVPSALFNAFMGKYPEAILTRMSGEDRLTFNEEELKTLLPSSSIAIGMGCGVSEEIYKIICYLLKNFKGQLLIDADGLNTVSKFGVDCLRDKSCKVLLTPHYKEFARLCQTPMKEVAYDPIAIAQVFAKEYGVTLLLKSNVSVITDGEEVYLNVRGGASLAKGGSGDVLSGLIASVAAQGNSLFDAAVAGSFVMGVAAELCEKSMGEYSVLGTDVANAIPKAILSLAEDAAKQG